MVDTTGNSILNFNVGLARVLNQQDAQGVNMPESRTRLTPIPTSAMSVLNRLLDAENVNKLVAESLVPQLGDLDLLRPDKFADALGEFIGDLKSAMESPDFAALSQADKDKLTGMCEELGHLEELMDSLSDFRNALFEG